MGFIVYAYTYSQTYVKSCRTHSVDSLGWNLTSCGNLGNQALKHILCSMNVIFTDEDFCTIDHKQFLCISFEFACSATAYPSSKYNMLQYVMSIWSTYVLPGCTCVISTQSLSFVWKRFIFIVSRLLPLLERAWGSPTMTWCMGVMSVRGWIYLCHTSGRHNFDGWCTYISRRSFHSFHLIFLAA